MATHTEPKTITGPYTLGAAALRALELAEIAARRNLADQICEVLDRSRCGAPLGVALAILTEIEGLVRP